MRMSTGLHRNLLRAAAAFSTLVVLAMTQGACNWLSELGETKRTPDRYLIPEGFVGWVEIDYGVAGAQPLPIEDGHALFRFSQSGRLATSTPLEFGTAKDEYFYVSAAGRRTRLPLTGWGKGGMIWAGSVGDNQSKGKSAQAHERFFVGTEKQFHASESLPPT